MQHQPLTPHLGEEIIGIDLSAPLDDDTFGRIEDLFSERSVLVFRDQQLDPTGLVAFSARFGEIETPLLNQFTLPEAPQVLVLSNLKEGDKPKGAHRQGHLWHTDLTYMPEPSLGSLLYGVEVPPEGGDTLFASIKVAYETLPEQRRKALDELKAVHSYPHAYAQLYPDREPLSEEQKARVPDIVHPLVRTHPVTGRKALYIGEHIIKEISGLSGEETAALVKELIAHITREAMIYRHKWRAGDLLMWDNRGVLHHATDYDDRKYRRVMHRTTIKGDRPY
ncbi:MAG: TauD/TfdA family dioxygenase [Acetobacterales bacterium]